MHHWQERETESGKDVKVTQEKAASFDASKEQGLPVIQKESSGMKAFEPVKFQPVRAYGYFDAEFAPKGNDIIIHFWPYGFHEAQGRGKRAPEFPVNFEVKLKEALKISFAENRIELNHDRDMGAYSVKAKNYADAFSPFTLATDVCKELYKILGGQS